MKVKQGRPTEDELEKLGNEIAEEWKTLGRCLAIKESKLLDIEQLHSRLGERGYQMLLYWKQKYRRTATYQTLNGALRHKLVQRKELAEKFCFENGEKEHRLISTETVGNKSSSGGGETEGRLTSTETVGKRSSTGVGKRKRGSQDKLNPFSPLQKRLKGEGKNTPTTTETVGSGYSSLSSEKLTLPKDEKTELLTEKYSELKDSPRLSDKAMQRSIICRGVVTEYGGKWNLREAAAYVTFHEGAVPKPLLFTCSVRPPTSRCPPIGSDELLVSNVIELSHDDPPDLEFSGGNITVTLMHSASDLKGYEVVIKQLVDPDGDEWKDLETRYSMDVSEAEKQEVSDCPQFVEASCLLAQCSTFAAIWRLKTFSFSRHTSVAPQLTCVVPDLPDVRVEVPLTSLPVDRDFTLKLKVQEFPSSEVEEEGTLVGPVLHISSSQNIEHFEPVIIKVPLTLRESQQDFSKISYEVVRLLYLDSEEKPESWTDITDQLEGQVFLKDGIVEFKVKHFSRFCPVCILKKSVPLLKDFLRQLSLTPMPQRVHFLACLRETLCYAKYQLLLFCFPSFKRIDVVQEISRYETPFVGEGKSKEPLCKGDKIVVSLTALTFECDSQKNEEIVLEFRGNDICDNSHMALIVSVDRDSVPVVKFRTCKEIQSKVVCEVTFSKPRPTSAVSSPMGVALVEERPHFSGDNLEIDQQPSTSGSGSSQLEYKGGKPSDAQLLELSSRIAPKWERVGLRLRLSQDQIDDIKLNKDDKAYKMLLDWRNTTTSPIPYKALYDALCHETVRLDVVAREFCLR